MKYGIEPLEKKAKVSHQYISLSIYQYISLYLFILKNDVTSSTAHDTKI